MRSSQDTVFEGETDLFDAVDRLLRKRLRDELASFFERRESLGDVWLLNDLEIGDDLRSARDEKASAEKARPRLRR